MDHIRVLSTYNQSLVYLQFTHCLDWVILKQSLTVELAYDV